MIIKSRINKIFLLLFLVLIFNKVKSKTLQYINEKTLSQKKCEEYNPEGSNAPTEEGRVEANPKEFPHMATLGFERENETHWECGGSLISDQYILTAAHCLSPPLTQGPKLVRIGDLNLAKSDDDAQPQEFKISAQIPHPGYEPRLGYNDIGLIKLDKKVQFSEYVKPICLHTEHEIPSKTAIATGWGYRGVNGPPSNELLKVTLKYIDHDTCNKTYYAISKRLLPKGIDDEIQLCAGGSTVDKDTCRGDSGGPLQIFSEKYYYITGIISFSATCSRAEIPAVYTRISHYVPWIENVVWSN